MPRTDKSASTDRFNPTTSGESAEAALAERLKLDEDYLLEDAVEKWLTEHFADLKLGAALIATQVRLENQKCMDMLAIHDDGQICVVELKRDTPERTVFVQILDYARLISGSLKSDFDALCQATHGIPLADFFRQKFKKELPKIQPVNPRLVIIAGDFDESLVHMASFLKEHRFDLHLIRYERLMTAGVARFKFHPVDISRKCFRVTGKMPASVARLRLFESNNCLWSDCREQNRLPVPVTESIQIQEWLQTGPVHLLVYVDQHGYVASGTVVPETGKQTGPGGEDLVQLPVTWEYAVDIAQAIFSSSLKQLMSATQPPETQGYQPPASGALEKLGPEEADSWARLMGQLKFRAEKEAKTGPV